MKPWCMSVVAGTYLLIAQSNISSTDCATRSSWPSLRFWLTGTVKLERRSPMKRFNGSILVRWYWNTLLGEKAVVGTSPYSEIVIAA